MPYIKTDRRSDIIGFINGRGTIINVDQIASDGELNFAITKLLDTWLDNRQDEGSGRRVSYENINTIMGVLACVQQEFYRRIAAPYEDAKKRETRDVFGAALTGYLDGLTGEGR